MLVQDKVTSTGSSVRAARILRVQNRAQEKIMPNFAANLTLLFTELPFLERFEAAAKADFTAVELLFPYAFAVEDIKRELHCLAGKAPAGVAGDVLRQTFVSNLRYAAAELGAAGLRLLIEPINTYDIPGYYLNRTQQALDILDEVGADNAFLQYDIYHAQRMEGELGTTIKNNLQRIGHIQLADNPGRNEPGTGEINYAWLFKHLDAIGYTGGIGCEYKPATTTLAGLGWREQLTA